MVRKWLLPTLSEILAKTEPTSIDPLLAGSNCEQETTNGLQKTKAEQQWQSAIHALGYLLNSLVNPELQHFHSNQITGLLLCAPVPLFNTSEIVGCFPTVIFSPAHPGQTLLPAHSGSQPAPTTATEVSLLPADPLHQEHFCLALTRQFGLVMSLDQDPQPQFQFSFDPNDVNLAWQSLRGCIMLTAPHQLAYIDELINQLPPTTPSYQVVMKFSQLLLQDLPVAANVTVTPAPETKSNLDVELLQALTHEIRTPLTTIRTLTRSLLRRADLNCQVLKRLETIDRECTEQINRMELIFQAVELAGMEEQEVDLTAMSFSHLLEQNLPLWQKQAERRNLNMEVAMPQQLPAVVSNPTILDRVLTGLVENFTRNLPAGSQIQVEVTPVGDQLKLQLQSVYSEMPTTEVSHLPSMTCGASEAIGQLLSFQPATGNLSLSLKVTKSLFQILGGKLVVKQNHRQGETMTIFLPML